MTDGVGGVVKLDAEVPCPRAESLREVTDVVNLVHMFKTFVDQHRFLKIQVRLALLCVLVLTLKRVADHADDIGHFGK